MRDKVEIALLHLRRLVELKGEKIGVMEMRIMLHGILGCQR